MSSVQLGENVKETNRAARSSRKSVIKEDKHVSAGNGAKTISGLDADTAAAFPRSRGLHLLVSARTASCISAHCRNNDDFILKGKDRFRAHRGHKATVLLSQMVLIRMDHGRHRS